MKAYLLTIMTLLLVACGSIQSTSSHVSMYGSVALEAGDPGYDSSVAIKSDHRQFGVCSGVLVAKNLVVTAAHCLKSKVIDLTDLNRVKSYIHFTKNSLATPSSHIRNIQEIKIHPLYDLNESINLYDIAWIRFSGEIPVGYKPAPVLNDMSPLISGATLIYTGHGLRENWEADLLLKSYGSYEVHPDVTDSLPGIFISHVKTNGNGPCSGDSGGPAFTQINNRWYVIGVLNGHHAYLGASTKCGQGYLLHNSIPHFSPWIEQSSGVNLNR